MRADLTELLARALGQVLEEAAFVFAEATDDPPPLAESVLQARLAYGGDHRGELVLAAPTDLAATLAANLLGEDEGGAAMTGDDADALGELLNMIAGSLLVELHGPDARCSLGLPRVALVPADQHERGLAEADVVASMLEEEGRRVDLSVTFGTGAVR